MSKYRDSDAIKISFGLLIKNSSGMPINSAWSLRFHAFLENLDLRNSYLRNFVRAFENNNLRFVLAKMKILRSDET